MLPDTHAQAAWVCAFFYRREAEQASELFDGSSRASKFRWLAARFALSLLHCLLVLPSPHCERLDLTIKDIHGFVRRSGISLSSQGEGRGGHLEAVNSTLPG